MARQFSSPEAELAYLIRTQQDGGLAPEKQSRSDGRKQVLRLDILKFPDSDHKPLYTSSDDSALTKLLDEAMETLEEDVRDIVHAHVFLGLGVRAISRLPWVPYERDAVHRRLKKGLEQLRNYLTTHEDAQLLINAHTREDHT